MLYNYTLVERDEECLKKESVIPVEEKGDGTGEDEIPAGNRESQHHLSGSA